ncbi:MAG: hypothetical protein JJ850_02700 [Kordiimonadaceae bacterium]|nr:hypothetical protein [Kordiimonadaceae bacterium]MBO6567284.1 hypothetical protein [Kordiimonadaceae bacterium]MBO6963502.1 hypothetical protein [Kordiimonadaceae bacterium]
MRIYSLDLGIKLRQLVAALGLTGLVFVPSSPSLSQSLQGLELTGPAKDIEIFLDGFFERFSKLSESRRSVENSRAMVPLLRHTRAKYEQSPASARGANPLDSARGLIAKLWLHGPKTWVITELDMLEDSAFAKVYFVSVDETRPDPIPFGFKFLRAGKRWKIGGYLDLRSMGGEHEGWQNLVLTGDSSSPEAVFTTYMDQIETYYSPKNAKESMQLAPQVEEKLSPMWMPTEDASQSLGRSMMTFSQLQPRNWNFVSSDYVDTNSELVIQASAGNPVMRRNLGMASLMGSGMKFTLEQVDGEWLLKSYGRSGQ